MTENNEAVEAIELSDQDQKDLAALMADHPEPTFHTVLEVWRAVLEPIDSEAVKPITPLWANRIITSFPEIYYRDLVEFQERYFSKLLSLRDILDWEIKTDADCLSYSEPEVDAEENSQHYKNLLTDWQVLILQWEMNWNPLHEHAAVELAAISEVHKMFFGPTGLTAYLDNIQFQFTDEDQQALADALNAIREG